MTTSLWRRYLPLQSVLDLPNYETSLRKWLSLRSHSSVDYQSAYQTYFCLVKPHIHRYSQILEHFSPQEYGFTSKLCQQKHNLIKQLFGKFPYDTEPLHAYELENSDRLTKNRIMSSVEIESILPKLPDSYSKIQLQKRPPNKELAAWAKQLNVTKVNFEGEVVKGKGIATTVLGMPTANIRVTPELSQLLLSFPSGIYNANLTISNNAENAGQYKGVVSLGTNPHYENLNDCRCVEIYIHHDFEGRVFYGAAISVEFLSIIRFEGKFASYDSFLNAMHNDITVSRNFFLGGEPPPKEIRKAAL